MNEIVTATPKLDGSMVVFFLYEDQVVVTTKRRMDSEQALWAKII
jgi:hypothetical protein